MWETFIFHGTKVKTINSIYEKSKTTKRTDNGIMIILPKNRPCERGL